ncbi:hypothetical protein F5880DRAFT_1530039 [Lentinula raphanica]|nr:hypothetical protein F5880DRAFT_1530039 [Lentinula raphanica]
MPSSPRLQRIHTTTSPISRRVLFHPREEVKRTNKLRRTSNLYDNDTGMLNSQLTDTQWATNIGLEATQETHSLTSTPIKNEVSLCIPSSPALPNHKSEINNICVKMEEPSGLKHYTASSPIKAEMFAVQIPPALSDYHNSPLDKRNVKEEHPTPLLYRLPGVTTCDLPPIYHLPDSYPRVNNVLAPTTAPLDLKPLVDMPVPSTTSMLTSESTLRVDDTPLASTARVFTPDMEPDVFTSDTKTPRVNSVLAATTAPSDLKPLVDMPVPSTTSMLTSESMLRVNDTPLASTARVFTIDMEPDVFTSDTKTPASIVLPVDRASVTAAAAVALDLNPPAHHALVPSTASSPTLRHIGHDAILDYAPPSEKEMVASAAHAVVDILHNLADELRERYTKDLTAVENERDLLRLQLAYQEKYINHLRILWSDQGLSPPSSPIMESQKDYFHL